MFSTRGVRECRGGGGGAWGVQAAALEESGQRRCLVAAAANRDAGRGNEPTRGCVRPGWVAGEGIIVKMHRSGGIWRAGFCKSGPPLFSAFGSRSSVLDQS
jgi:hypothetical protein